MKKVYLKICKVEELHKIIEAKIYSLAIAKSYSEFCQMNNSAEGISK